MLFLIHMTVHVPHAMPMAEWDALKQAEKEVAQRLQREGTWRHLWRVAGRYENFSVFDVADADVLHALLSGLPLFPHMDISVTALARHPSALDSMEDVCRAIRYRNA